MAFWPGPTTKLTLHLVKLLSCSFSCYILLIIDLSPGVSSGLRVGKDLPLHAEEGKASVLGDISCGFLMWDEDAYGSTPCCCDSKESIGISKQCTSVSPIALVPWSHSCILVGCAIFSRG